VAHELPREPRAKGGAIADLFARREDAALEFPGGDAQRGLDLQTALWRRDLLIDPPVIEDSRMASGCCKRLLIAKNNELPRRSQISARLRLARDSSAAVVSRSAVALHAFRKPIPQRRNSRSGWGRILIGASRASNKEGNFANVAADASGAT
jgi:hypothetical protein